MYIVIYYFSWLYIIFYYYIIFILLYYYYITIIIIIVLSTYMTLYSTIPLLCVCCSSRPFLLFLSPIPLAPWGPEVASVFALPGTLLGRRLDQI